jgi:hypothetical protein
MSVTRWDVTPRNASLGPCATVQEGAAAAAHFFKRAALAADEAAWKAAADISGGAPPNSLFVQKISDNVEVHLTNVHIRVEDPVSCPSSPWAIGLTERPPKVHISVQMYLWIQ